MRQTSRAVALLLTLESAQAANRSIVLNVPTPTAGVATSETFFNPLAATLVTESQKINSRTAGYSSVLPNAIFASTQETSPQWKTASYHMAKAGLSATNGTFLLGSTCIACLGGGGVWCSRTYAYLETGAGSTTYNSQVTAYAGGTMKTLSGSDTAQTGGAALDQGACCESVAAFSTFIGTLSVPLGTYTTITSSISKTTGVTMIADACPAVQLGTWASGTAPASIYGGDAKLDNTTVNWSSWWCSNGLYKRVYATTTIVMNSQQIMQSGTNKRMELAMVGCPQMAAACNQTNSSVSQLLSTSAATKVYAMPASGFSVNDKCSWVVYAVDAAPTFVLQDSAGTGTRGLVSANWQIHNMEYTSAASWSTTSQSLVESPASSSGWIQSASGLSRDSMLPLFGMPAPQFASLRTWYSQGSTGVDAVTGMSSNWSSVGQAPIVNTKAVSTQLAAVKSQLYGNVANVPVSGNVISTTTAVLTATQNYGKYNNTEFDLRAMRYFPAMTAQTVWTAGSSLSTQYSTALASYNTAKTTWDAYVAILDKNAKQDAFAALFSPPKAPTVPPLPNMPWVPAAYSGYVRATAAQTKAYSVGSTVGTTVASPTAQEFWTSLAAAQTVGGWGSFTATIFTYRNGWGKSFGTIGYSGDADNQSMSDVWNYKWSCALISTTAQPNSQCEASYTASAGAAATSSGSTAANAVKLITVVSLWATSNTNGANASGNTIPAKYLWSANGFQITFKASAWKSGIVGLTPLGANAAPVAAKSLSGIAGAQALAATSAAALAVAAALY